MRTDAQITADAKDEQAFSNMTSFEIWAGNVCAAGNGCKHDSLWGGAAQDPEVDCPLITVAILGRTPQEWLAQTEPADAESQHYHCTEYEEEPATVDDHISPEPVPQGEPLPGQLSLFQEMVAVTAIPEQILTSDSLLVRSGDTLVVRVDEGADLDLETGEQVRAEIMRRLPGLADVVIIRAAQVAAFRPKDTGS
jgi:hypothetical protein